MAVTAESVVAVPEWFTGALAELPEHREVEVAGRAIHLRCWGRAGTAGVVLVHGGSAHSGWWDHIAPLLGTTRRVVAVDLSGHGDSATRSRYPIEGWADEVMTAADAGGTPVLYIRCERGLVSRERASEIAGLFDRRATVVELAEAGHHPMLDQPLPLVATVRTVLAQWDSMRPSALIRNPQ
ncbi:alpha/beta fold hydrolase [Nocardia vaccinii]|uniref:alpha/beta fold hydrolase n=1 Tax=Nocardia vaccinii TaxID=1822 RepID=UPI0008337270|nr:alpha/beta hydrolase [Nocardia vaccinii]